MSFYRRTSGRRHFLPHPSELKFRPRSTDAARIVRTRQEDHELHRAQIKADIDRARLKSTKPTEGRAPGVPLMQPSSLTT